MAKKFYLGIDNVARRVRKPYAEVGGVARAITKGYIGIDSIARQVHPNDPVGYIGTTWRFRSDIDYGEWFDFIYSHCEDEYDVYLAFDISFTCPGGISKYPYGVAYDFRRMEFYSDGDGGDSVYFYSADDEIDEYFYVGECGIWEEYGTITLNEEPSELLFYLLQTFAEEVTEFNTDFYIGTTWEFYVDMDRVMYFEYVQTYATTNRAVWFDFAFTDGMGDSYIGMRLDPSIIYYRETATISRIAGDFDSEESPPWGEYYESDGRRHITLNEAPSLEFLHFLKTFAERSTLI